jgi:hypothetical protein
MRNLLLGSVGAPLPGGLSPPLRTPLTRSDTAFEIFSSTSGASSSGTHGDTDELMIQLRGGDVVLIEPVEVANTGDAGGSLTALYDDSVA